MRVISGKMKGRKLFAPENNDVRPTTDRIKETLFNILASKGACGEISVLDLFCGSGALGIEALSRGASKVVFIDRDNESMRLTKQNLAHVKALPSDYETYTVDYLFALKKLKGRRFDLIFADPPYAAGFEDTILKAVFDADVLSDNGVFVLEHSVGVKVNANGFSEDLRICGNTALSFFTKEKENEN